MATLREIQLGELDILKEIDRVCREQHLPYTLSSGTMLGAIRHQGFIPWDDDVDICMLAKDAEKLNAFIDHDRFFLQSPKTDPESPFPFYKVRKNGTLMEEEVLRNLNIHKGLWVDIFALFPAGKSTFSKKMQFQLGRILHSFRCRYINARRTPPKRAFLAKIPPKCALWMDDLLTQGIRLLGSKTSEEYFVPGDGNFQSRFKKCSFFDSRGEYAFEDAILYGPKDFDAYLKKLYGENYMIPQKYGHNVNYDNVKV